MQLATHLHGQTTDRPPLLIAHGLFGSARNWGAVARRLSERRQVAAVDLRNHGDSPRDPEMSYPAMAGDLAQAIEALGGRADVLGHSMGGKAAMVMALTAPERVRRLVVADIAPVAYGHSQIGYVRAMQSLDLAGVARRSDADARLAAAVPDPGVRAFLLQSLAVKDGAAAWKLALDTLAEEMPSVMGFPDAGTPFPGATLFLTGGASDYVRPEHWDRIRALFPAAEHIAIAGAGHWVHAEEPRPFTDAVEAFLSG